MQGDLAGCDASDSGPNQHRGAVLDQGDEPQLWTRTAPTAGRRPAERLVILRLVGDVQGTAVEADQAPSPVPGAFRRLDRDRVDPLIVQVLEHLPPPPRARLRDPGFAGHRDGRRRSKEPCEALEQAPQPLAGGRRPVQRQRDHVVDDHVRRQIPLPEADPAALSEHGLNGGHRKRLRAYAQTDVIRYPRATWKSGNGSCHTESSCPSVRQDTARWQLNEQYCP